MVAKISMGTSLYGALAYNGLKVNEGEGRLLAVNRIFDDGSGHVDIARAEQDFKRFMPEQVRTRNKVIHISLNPQRPSDRHGTGTARTRVSRQAWLRRPALSRVQARGCVRKGRMINISLARD